MARVTPSERVSRARAHLLLDHPWFITLSLRLRIIEDASLTPTMSTDGTRLVFSPQWVSERSDAEMVAVIAHEVMHCALLHPYRVGSRDLKLWNKACDYAINPLLIADHFQLPAGMLYDRQYEGMSAETIYARLAREKPERPKSGGQDGEQDEPIPDFTRAPAPQSGNDGNAPAAPDQTGEQSARGVSGTQKVREPQPMSATDWQIAAEQATSVSRKAGKMPGDVERAVKESRRSTTDWRAALRDFIEQTTPTDYSWLNPNRRFVAAGVYLPGVVREQLPRLAIAIDTSMSINRGLLSLFGEELTAIVREARPECVDVLYCDAEVRHVQRFTPDDPEIRLEPRGGGGTKFQPVFDRLADDPPAGLVYFTDLEGPAPMPPEYPVLWVTTEAATAVAPFGETVRIQA